MSNELPDHLRRVGNAIVAVHPYCWSPMSNAPRDGTHFIYLQRIWIVSVAGPAKFQFNMCGLHRERSAPESEGYWSTSRYSIPDDYARGWWTTHPTFHDGVMILPPDAFDLPVIKQLEEVAKGDAP